MCLVCIFIFCFYFLTLFFKNYFYFQKIKNLKICLIWLLIFCFYEIKILKIYDILISCLFVFLDLLKITFIVTSILFYPKWGFYFQPKTLKTRIYCFHFLLVFYFHFHWKCFQKSNQTHFHHHFLFLVKMKTKTIKPNTPLVIHFINIILFLSIKISKKKDKGQYIKYYQRKGKA